MKKVFCELLSLQKHTQHSQVWKHTDKISQMHIHNYFSVVQLAQWLGQIYYLQCCCQGLETQGRGQGVKVQGQGQGLDVQGRGLEN